MYALCLFDRIFNIQFRLRREPDSITEYSDSLISLINPNSSIQYQTPVWGSLNLVGGNSELEANSSEIRYDIFKTVSCYIEPHYRK